MKIFQFVAYSTALFLFLTDNRVLRASIQSECKVAMGQKLAGSKHVKFNIVELLGNKSPT